jgi:hypothetical protein
MRHGFVMLVLSALLSAGCASIRDTEFSQVRPQGAAEPLRVAVVDPVISLGLRPDTIQPEGNWWGRQFDGRGTVIVSYRPADDVALAIIDGLTIAKRYNRIFYVDSIEQARKFKADRVMTVKVNDYRIVSLGANGWYHLVVVLGPLHPEYWLRWLSWEARIDMEVEMYALPGGEHVFQRHLSRHYYKTVRYVREQYMINNLLDFLRFQALPEFLGEMFYLDTIPVLPPADGAAGKAATPPSPPAPVEPRVLPASPAVSGAAG